MRTLSNITAAAAAVNEHSSSSHLTHPASVSVAARANSSLTYQTARFTHSFDFLIATISENVTFFDGCVCFGEATESLGLRTPVVARATFGSCTKQMRK